MYVNCVNSDVTFLDTSDIYSPCTNEILVGKVVSVGETCVTFNFQIHEVVCFPLANQEHQLIFRRLEIWDVGFLSLCESTYSGILSCLESKEGIGMLRHENLMPLRQILVL